jgi:hypothetical protein
MSRDSWLFLFAVLSPLIGVAQIVVQILLRKPVAVTTMSAKRGKSTASTQDSSPAISRTQLGVILASLIISSALGLVGFYFSYTNQNALRAELQPGHIESTAKQWLKGFGYITDDLPATPDMDFVFKAINLPGHPVLIMRDKAHAGYLTIQGEVTIAEEHQKIIEKLQPERLRQINHDLTIELARMRTDYLQATSTPLHAVLFRRQLPVSNSLSEAVLLNTVAEVVDEENLVVEVILRDIGQ